jgi:hypothetical protein
VEKLTHGPVGDRRVDAAFHRVCHHAIGIVGDEPRHHALRLISISDCF